MTNIISCALCKRDAQLFETIKTKYYYRCVYCDAIQLHPNHYLTREEEQAFYGTHNNDVHDPGYQKFVSPIVNSVFQHYNPNHQGLDYGAGTGPVITKMLTDKGYNMTLYDPFFWKDNAVLNQNYDFIVCCEVVEHFHNPHKEFLQLKELLKEMGSLFLMTAIYHDEIDFKKWFYKNDPTHVFFYTVKTFETIQRMYNFKSLHVNHRLIQLSL